MRHNPPKFKVYTIQAEIHWVSPEHCLPPDGLICYGYWDTPTRDFFRQFTRHGEEWYFEGDGNTHFTHKPDYWTRSMPNVYLPLSRY